jgi:hypothetical protein
VIEAAEKCNICHLPMHRVEPGQTNHPGCFPRGPATFDEPSGSMDGEAMAIRRELSDMILHAEYNSDRTLQVAIGPSEVGEPCDRRLGYRIAGIEPVNETDPWPAVVGSSIHTWLDNAVTRYENYTNMGRYLTETIVHPDDMVTGHSDLYDAKRRMVIDWKTVSTKNLAKFKEEGPPESYVIQVNLYAMGQIRAGRPVDKVCLVALPRAGWLSGMYVWVDDYDPEIAQQALDRMYRIGGKLLALDVIANPHRWAQVEATPSRLCGWCPFYRQGGDDGQGADADGCPGLA